MWSVHSKQTVRIHYRPQLTMFITTYWLMAAETGLLIQMSGREVLQGALLQNNLDVLAIRQNSRLLLISLNQGLYESLIYTSSHVDGPYDACYALLWCSR